MKTSLPRILFMALWIADIVATVIFISLHGTDAEANPLMRSLIVNHGFIGFAIVKLAILAFWLALSTHIKWWINAILAAIMLPVVIMGILTILIPIT